MPSLPGKKSILPFLAAALALAGCAATGKPAVWQDQETNFSAYTRLLLHPVVNETGKDFEEDVAALLTTRLREEFLDRNLPVSESPPATADKVMTVDSALLIFVPGDAFKRWLMPGAGKTQCTVRTRLVDTETGRAVAEIVTAKEVGAGGLYSAGADQWILGEVAKDIADAVADILKPGVGK